MTSVRKTFVQESEFDHKKKKILLVRVLFEEDNQIVSVLCVSRPTWKKEETIVGCYVQLIKLKKEQLHILIKEKHNF